MLDTLKKMFGKDKEKKPKEESPKKKDSLFSDEYFKEEDFGFPEPDKMDRLSRTGEQSPGWRKKFEQNLPEIGNERHMPQRPRNPRPQQERSPPLQREFQKPAPRESREQPRRVEKLPEPEIRTIRGSTRPRQAPPEGGEKLDEIISRLDSIERRLSRLEGRQ